MGDRPASYREWRKLLLRDVYEVERAFKLWDDQADEVMHQVAYSAPAGAPWVKLPNRFEQLTYLLASVCDIGPYNIDPTPLTDFLRMAQHCESEMVSQTYAHSIDDFGRTRDRVVPIANRLMTAMIAGAGLEDREKPFDPAQLPGPNDDRDAWMYQERKRGQTVGQIMLNLRDKSEWSYIDSEPGIRSAIDRYCRRNSLPLLRRK